jgi:ubiquinone/menaquinone biosynthesis C-methylase UbiE
LEMIYNLRMGRNSKDTSWQRVAPWYNRITDQGQGHYYHQHVVIPNVLRLLDLTDQPLTSNLKLLDLACGNGVLANALPKNLEYTGIDIAPSLIKEAERTDRNPKHSYLVADITNLSNFPNLPNTFTAATIILALQNIRDPVSVLNNVSKLLVVNSKLIIVLNHPAFRIPRQSSWGIDESKKTQYRRIDRYMSPMEIPINMNPSDRNSAVTMSYHFPISFYSSILRDSGFLIETIEEWTSDKESEGRTAKMENRSRSEFPLFLAIKAIKKAS